MTFADAQQEATFKLQPIGFVRRSGKRISLEILDPFRPALKQLDQFSHVIVLWWADKHDNQKSRTKMQTEPPYAKGHITGVFACRAEYRPNPIALTVCKLASVDEKLGLIEVGNIDAFGGTPILDLKAYFPICERVKQASLPSWLVGWPEWFPDEGLGL